MMPNSRQILFTFDLFLAANKKRTTLETDVARHRHTTSSTVELKFDPRRNVGIAQLVRKMGGQGTTSCTHFHEMQCIQIRRIFPCTAQEGNGSGWQNSDPKDEAGLGTNMA